MSSPIMATASPPSPRSLASTRSTRSTPRRWRRNAGRLPAPPGPARRSCRSPGSAAPVCLRSSARWLEPSNTSAPKPATLSKYHDDLRSGPHPNPPPQAGDGVRGGAEDGWGLPTSATALSQAKRLVVKIGSALLVGEDGEIDRPWLDALVDDLARCRARRQEVIVVSSGAIAVGRRHLGLHGRALRLEEKQAAAATGKIRLAHAYQEALARHGITVAQILLTLEDTEERRRHLNARATFAQ